MVALDDTGVYDPFDSVNALLDQLELEAKATKRLVEEPWTAMFPGGRSTPIEEPRGSSGSSKQKQTAPIRSPPQPSHLFVPMPKRDKGDNQPPKKAPGSGALPIPMLPRKRPAQKTNNPQNKMPAFSPEFIVLPRPVRSVFDVVPQKRIANLDFGSLDHHYRKPKRVRERHRSDSHLQTICNNLREFRERHYKGSLRECTYRMSQLEEAQRRSSVGRYS